LALAANKSVSIVVSKLLAKGADVNAGDSNGVTPLMAACLNKTVSDKVVSALVTAGADLSAKNKSGESAAQIAIKVGTKACSALGR
jgi:ankyrin repeat protein